MVAEIVFRPKRTAAFTFKPVFFTKFYIVYSAYMINIIVKSVPVHISDNIEILSTIP